MSSHAQVSFDISIYLCFRKFLLRKFKAYPFKCIYLKTFVYETLQKLDSVVQTLTKEDGL